MTTPALSRPALAAGLRVSMMGFSSTERRKTASAERAPGEEGQRHPFILDTRFILFTGNAKRVSVSAAAPNPGLVMSLPPRAKGLDL